MSVSVLHAVSCHMSFLRLSENIKGRLKQEVNISFTIRGLQGTLKCKNLMRKTVGLADVSYGIMQRVSLAVLYDCSE